MDVSSPYKYGSDVGLERLSYQSKIISINGESETSPISEIAITKLLYLEFIGSFEAAALSFTTERVFRA